jgi:ABC-2 type transport system ATP-binding protein
MNTPEELFKKHNTENLEDIFIEYVSKLSSKDAVLSFKEIRQQGKEV